MKGCRALLGPATLIIGSVRNLLQMQAPVNILIFVNTGAFDNHYNIYAKVCAVGLERCIIAYDTNWRTTP